MARKRGLLFIDVIEVLREAILTGDYASDHLLPTEEFLAAKLGVSRTVLRQSMVWLISEGLVEPKHGSGIFIRKRRRGTVTRTGDVFHDLSLTGTPKYTMGATDDHTARLLGIDTVDAAYQSERIARLATDRRVLLSTVLPHRTAAQVGVTDLLPDRGELLDALARRFGPLHAIDVTGVVTASPRQAALLGLAQPTVLLRTTRVTRDAQELPLLADVQYAAGYETDLVTPVT